MANAYTIYLQLLLTCAALLGPLTAVTFSVSSETALIRSGSKQQTKATDGYPSYGPVSCVPGNPQLPNFIKPMQIDPKRILGKWYRSNEWFPGITQDRVNIVNIITTYSNMFNDSLTIYPGTNRPAVAFEQVIAYYDVIGNQCGSGSFGALEYATVDGQYRGIGFLFGRAAVDSVIILSTDYDTYVLYYTCFQYNVTSGICSRPDFTVDTRQPANLVSSSTASAINDAVNRILAPFCFTPDMLRLVSAFLGGVADCPFLPLPTTGCYNSLRDSYRYLGDPNYASGSSKLKIRAKLFKKL